MLISWRFNHQRFDVLFIDPSINSFFAEGSGTLALDLAMTYASAETEAAKSCFGPYKVPKPKKKRREKWSIFVVNGWTDDVNVAGSYFLLFSRFFFWFAGCSD